MVVFPTRLLGYAPSLLCLVSSSATMFTLMLDRISKLSLTKSKINTELATFKSVATLTLR